MNENGANTVTVDNLYHGGYYVFELTGDPGNEDIDVKLIASRTEGVDAIIGSHSHLVGEMKTVDVTTVDGEKKTCFVAYSLGDFYSSLPASYARGCRQSLILNLQFTKNGETGVTALSAVSYTPLYLIDNGEDAACRYEILPIRSAVSSGRFPDWNDTLTAAIGDLRASTASDFDSGR